MEFKEKHLCVGREKFFQRVTKPDPDETPLRRQRKALLELRVEHFAGNTSA